MRSRVWVRQWLDVDRRLQHGHYNRLMHELRYKDPGSYFNFPRVPPKAQESFWVRQWLDVDRRLQHGHYHRLIYEQRYKDPASYINFLRVPPDMFDELLGRLGPLIPKQSPRVENLSNQA